MRLKSYQSHNSAELQLQYPGTSPPNARALPDGEKLAAWQGSCAKQLFREMLLSSKWNCSRFSSRGELQGSMACSQAAAKSTQFGHTRLAMHNRRSRCQLLESYQAEVRHCTTPRIMQGIPKSSFNPSAFRYPFIPRPNPAD